mgnify:CR=1 FL=1
MELNELPQMDPRALKATSVKAEDEHANSAEPQALKITAASSNPKMFTLPWHKPLATWPKDLLANLPRGISRHVVRFVHVGDEVYAMKEITRQVAEREYEILRRLQKLELPTVTPIAVVIGRHTREGEPLEAILVTRHLKFSLPYRALFARNLRPDTAERLIDALAVLLVRLHLAGFYWGDVSLSNVLFLRDADAFSAFLVDAETGDLQAQLTDGQREYDIDLARTNIIGELMDLASGKLLPGDVDEIEVGNRLVDRYHSLWSALTDTDKFKPYGATPGHGIEWARLITQWALSSFANLDGAQPYVDAAEHLFARAVADAWNADGTVGLAYTTDWNGKPVVTDRMHWTLAESLNTSATLYAATGEEMYANWYATFAQYVDEHVIDHESGSWFHQLDKNNHVIGTVWPGKSDLYHAFQSTLIPFLDPAVSIATAVKNAA